MAGDGVGDLLFIPPPRTDRTIFRCLYGGCCCDGLMIDNGLTNKSSAWLIHGIFVIVVGAVVDNEAEIVVIPIPR